MLSEERLYGADRMETRKRAQYYHIDQHQCNAMEYTLTIKSIANVTHGTDSE